MASISVRASIAWADAPPSEPTSTVVLTSPGRRFVDIRILWAADQGTTPPAARVGATAHFTGLEWAFAGTSTSSKVEQKEGVTAGAWRHWVDSLHASTAAVVDEGLCYAQPDGSTRETGAMAHPDTGAVTEYEEVWLDPAPEGTTTARPRSVVLRLGAEGTAPPVGQVVQLGRLCQGVVRSGPDRFLAERWQWTEGAGGGGWQCVYRHGTGDLPIRAMLEDDGVQEGATVTDAEGNVWEVLEAVDV